MPVVACSAWDLIASTPVRWVESPLGILPCTTRHTLTPKAVSPKPQKTFFTNVRPSLAEPLFTVDLNHDKPGTYDFGFINSSKYTGDIKYLPVDNSQGFWGVTSTSYGIGDSSNMKEKSMNAIVDTGTTLLLVPKKVLKAYYKHVDGAKDSSDAGGYIFPCDTTLPDFLIGFGDYTAVIPGSAVNNSVIDDTSKSSTRSLLSIPNPLCDPVY